MSDTELTRPIIGIENRAPQEVFDIMADRFRSAIASRQPVVTDEMVEAFKFAHADWLMRPDKQYDEVVRHALEAALTKPDEPS